MSLDDGLFDKMPRRPAPTRLDDGTAARLLAGGLASADAPPGYAAVATVLRAAAAPPRAAELSGEDAARAAFTAARHVEPAPRRRHPARVAVLVAAGVLCLGGVAAAATGTLPRPVQSAAHDAFGSVGVSVPAPHPATRSTTPAPLRHIPVTTTPPPRVLHPRPSHPTPTTPPTTVPRRTPPTRTGSTLAVLLCRAAASGRLTPHGSAAEQRAYATLAQLAGGAANIPSYCRGVLAG